ncbi:MAG TPA: radical SAM protein, partial [Ignavibacteriales bacterium]|nr:radical SAM protein [Ignavibacteriales bacterium]
FPAWDLFEIHKYRGSSIAERRRPVGSLETSRGCVFNCCFCNKKMYGNSFRPKSAIRVVDEIEHMLDVGFKEIRIQDDMFSTNIKRAKAICDEIIKRKLKFFWTLFNGIRVDSV